MKKAAIVGSKTLAQYIAHELKRSGLWNVVGFFDDFEKIDALVEGYPILGATDQIIRKFRDKSFDSLFIGIGYEHLEFKRQLWDSLKGVVEFGTYVHPSCFLDESALVREGAFLSAKCIVDQHCQIGENVFMYPGCVIAHHSQIGEHCFLAPAVSVAGFCQVGPLSFLGIGAVVKDHVNIGKKSRVGAGAVVVRDTLPEKTYAGVPAKPL